MTDEALQAALAAAAAAPVLVVAADYDGTLAPIVADPAAAVPHRPALDALVALGRRESVEAVIVSGRSREALLTLTGGPDRVLLIGSHGAEWPDGTRGGADPGALVDALTAVADRYEGTLVEPKPAGAALHYRHARSPAEAAAAAREVGARHEARVIDGKLVVELLLSDADKGTAIRRVREDAGAAAVVFFGDDTTDEDVFTTLGGIDVGVKVGDGDTGARFRVDDPPGVAAALRWLVEVRSGAAEARRELG